MVSSPTDLIPFIGARSLSKFIWTKSPVDFCPPVPITPLLPPKYFSASKELSTTVGAVGLGPASAIASASDLPPFSINSFTLAR